MSRRLQREDRKNKPNASSESELKHEKLSILMFILHIYPTAFSTRILRQMNLTLTNLLLAQGPLILSGCNKDDDPIDHLGWRQQFSWGEERDSKHN